jgi:hypothetical protein
MASSNSELLTEVREMGQYDEAELSDPSLITCIKLAKRHLRVAAQLENPNWYTEPIKEEALFWTTMLFSKVQSGELDSKAISVGEIEEDSMFAAADGEVTTWYRNYDSAVDRLLADERGVASLSRTTRTTIDGDRYYSRD